MPTVPGRAMTKDLFRWRSGIVLIGIAMALSAGLGYLRISGGIGLGFALYASNVLLLMEIGRSLLRQGASAKPKLLSALSSSGRLLFLAVSLAAIALFLGRDVVLGACGGFLIAQVNLHVPTYRNRREGK